MSLSFALVTFAQQPPPRDERAIAVLQRAALALGGVVPQDSEAVGTVRLVEGSDDGSGRIRIATRGLDQSIDEITTSQEHRVEAFKQGLGTHKRGEETTEASLEWACSAQSLAFPIQFLVGSLKNPDMAFEYVGEGTLEGAPAVHVRVWNTYASQEKLRHLVEFTVKDVWLDAKTGLPVQILFERRAAGGAEPRIPMGYLYSDYRSIGGILYPFHIQRLYNGTPWATITISSVRLNTGLPESDLAIR
jgi:hypothetical protein